MLMEPPKQAPLPRVGLGSGDGPEPRPERLRIASREPTVEIVGSALSVTWARSCMVKRSGNGDFGAACLQGHRLSAGSEPLYLFYLVPRAASRLQMQPEEPVVACNGPTKTATLTMLARRLRLAEMHQGLRRGHHA